MLKFKPQPLQVSQPLNPEQLREILTNAHFATQDVTANYPKGTKGIRFYQNTVAGIREILGLSGWRRETIQGTECTVSKAGERVIVAKGDTATGSCDQVPLPQYRRGRGSCAVINANSEQLSLFDDDDQIHPSLCCWVLLHRVTDECIQFELSLASEVNESGRVIKWAKRFPEESIDLILNIPAMEENNDEIAEINVELSKRAR